MAFWTPVGFTIDGGEASFKAGAHNTLNGLEPTFTVPAAGWLHRIAYFDVCESSGGCEGYSTDAARNYSFTVTTPTTWRRRPRNLSGLVVAIANGRFL